MDYWCLRRIYAALTLTLVACLLPITDAQSLNGFIITTTTSSITVTKDGFQSPTPYIMYIAEISFDDGVTCVSTLSSQCISSGLQAGSRYTVTVVSTDLQLLAGSPVFVYTVPKPPRSISSQVESSSSLILTVTEPSTPCGQIELYLISFATTDGSTRNVSEPASCGSGDTKISVDELSSGTTYTFTAQTCVNGDTVCSTEISTDGVTAGADPPNSVRLFAPPSGDNSTSLTLTWSEPSGGASGLEFRVRLVGRGSEEGVTPSARLSHNFTGLQPATKYTARVWSRQIGEASLQSQQVSASGFTAPSQPQSPVEVTNETTTETFRVMWTAVPGWVYTVFVHKDGDADDVHPRVASPPCRFASSSCSVDVTSVYGTGELPGQSYSVYLMAGISADITSAWSEASQVRTKPQLVSLVTIDQVTTTSIRLLYTDGSSDSEFDSYHFSISPEDHGAVNMARGDTPRQIDFDSLVPGTLYVISAFTQSGQTKSETQTWTEFTYPSPPKLTCYPGVSPTNTSITLGVEQGEGLVDAFNITCEPSTVTGGAMCYPADVTVDSSWTEFTFSDLTESTDYVFSARAVVSYEGMKEKESSQSTIVCGTIQQSQRAPVLVLGPEVATPSVQDGTPAGLREERITVEFVNPFSDANGSIVDYSVILWSEEYQYSDETDGAMNITDTWYTNDVKTSGQTIGPYVTIRCASLFTAPDQCAIVSGRDTAKRRRRKRATPGERVTLAIGADTSCDPEQPRDYCNGPLRPNTGYIVMIRAHGTKGEFTDGYRSDVIRTGSQSPGGPVDNIYDDKVSRPIAAIAAGTAVAAVIFVVAVVVVVVLYRKGKLCRGSGPQKTIPLQVQGGHRKVNDNGTDRKDLFKTFQEHFDNLLLNDGLRLSAEFRELQSAGHGTFRVAKQDQNQTKNRFETILPYDHSRVHLKGGSSDYINASWMPGYQSKAAYIATQGPLSSTCDDFWRMVWNYNVSVIVMMTKCTENDQEVCHKYWPSESKVARYGDLTVTIKDVERWDEYVISQMTISKGSETRLLSHCHYTGWPAADVPQRPRSLLGLVAQARSRSSNRQGHKSDESPVVVHCSAGVGRTGVFIALDHVLQSIEENGKIDVFGVVKAMRMNRPMMVQTEIQYKFIHHCIAASLMGEDGYMTLEDDDYLRPKDNHYRTLEGNDYLTPEDNEYLTLDDEHYEVIPDRPESEVSQQQNSEQFMVNSDYLTVSQTT